MGLGRVTIVVLCGCGRLAFDSLSTDGGGDPGTIDDSGVDALRACGGTTHQITDNFDDNMRDVALWGNAYMDVLTTYDESLGRLAIPIGANSTDDWAGYTSSTGYQLAEDRVFVEVLQVSAPNTTTFFGAWDTIAKTDGPSIESEFGRLEFRRRVGGTILDLADVSTYDPVEHRWWQIRETGGRTYWQLSPDGDNWTTWYQEDSPAGTMAFIELAAGSNLATASPGRAVFDNLNGGGAPPGCP